MESCENCKYYRRLKHNFKQYVGFSDSHCCVLFSDDFSDDYNGFIVEVDPVDCCESFTQISHEKIGA